MLVQKIELLLNRFGIEKRVFALEWGYVNCAACLPVPFTDIVFFGFNPHYSDDESVLLHEVGHVFLDTYFGTDVVPKEEFEDVFGKNTILFLSKKPEDARRYKSYISAYARTHPQEDFAETFSYVVLNRNASFKSKDLKRKVAFVKGCIKRAG